MDANDLYGLPLERFVPARRELVKELKASGRRDDAAAAAALRKPTVAAWAVNQLVRGEPERLSRLVTAGDAARDAQAGLLRGVDERPALRRASERMRDALDELARAAVALLEAAGHSAAPALLDRVGDTLQAAALDDDARAEVLVGRLTRELRHVGLGGAVQAPAAAQPAAPTQPPRPGGAPAAERERLARERAEAERSAAARHAARLAESHARRELDRAHRAAQAAQDRRDRAAAALAQAEAAVEVAQGAVASAADAHRRAQDALA